MKRRSMLLSGASVVLVGCATGLVTGISYDEKITALAATPDWSTVIVFGKEYDYEFTPSQQLVAQLTGPMRTRLTASFGWGSLDEDNMLTLDMSLFIPYADLSQEEKDSSKSNRDRDMYRETLHLRRVKKTQNPERFGVQPLNHPYDVHIYANVPPGTSVPRKALNSLIDTAAVIILVPIIFYALSREESRHSR